MQTIKLISTISYNTESFLQMTLTRLVKDGKLDYAMYIHHNAEQDELKAHYHVVMKPSSRIDTLLLRNEFQEVDLEHPDLPPLGVMTIHASKRFDDWYLYAIHHKGYLMSKGETRLYHYSIEDIWSTDKLLLETLVDEMDISRYRCYEAIYESFEDGRTFSSLVADGLVPLGWIYQFKTLYQALEEEHKAQLDKLMRPKPEFTDEDWLKMQNRLDRLEYRYMPLPTKTKQVELEEAGDVIAKRDPFTYRGEYNNHEDEEE